MSDLVTLGPTAQEHLPALHHEEARPQTRCWLGDTSQRWHRDLIASPHAEHLTIFRGGRPAGFVVLAGIGDVNRSIELRRIVTYQEHRGHGAGRLAMNASFERAFTVHGAHRLWLDVKSGNAVARRLYSSLGLIVEGELREVMLEPGGGFSSLVVMALLDREWRPAA